MSDLLRVYLDPDEIGQDGYPFAWHGLWHATCLLREPAIKDLVRQQAGHRCERCGHPYPPGVAETCPRGEWTPCDESCTHGGPTRVFLISTGQYVPVNHPDFLYDVVGYGTDVEAVEAQWRILTVHHLNGVKHDCRWWNLTALCQRCHLAIQGRVVMERVWPWEHSEWFKPHAAGWYASAYLGEELTREETIARLDELLDLERQIQ